MNTIVCPDCGYRDPSPDGLDAWRLTMYPHGFPETKDRRYDSEPEDEWEALGACEGCVICPRCATEVDLQSGEVHGGCDSCADFGCENVAPASITKKPRAGQKALFDR